jgi:hypothetical protein
MSASDKGNRMYQNLKKMLIDTDNRLMILLLAVALIVIGAILLAFGVEKKMSMYLSFFAVNA